jgi:hypothetical protein
MVTTIAIRKKVILDQIFPFRFHRCLIPPQKFMPDFENELPCGIDYKSGMKFVKITPHEYQGEIVEEIRYLCNKSSLLTCLFRRRRVDGQTQELRRRELKRNGRPHTYYRKKDRVIFFNEKRYSTVHKCNQLSKWKRFSHLFF